MTAVWNIFKVELRLSLTSPDMLLFGLGFPAGIMLLLGFISKPEALRLDFGGVMAVGICATGLMGLPLSLSDYRHRKILKRFKVTPVSPAYLLCSQALTQAVFSAISGAVVWAIAALCFKVSLSGSAGRFVASYAFVLFSIYSLGFLIASLSPNMKAANALCSLLYFPMLFLSGATVPYEIMPRGLRAAADFFPLTQGIKILKGAVTGLPAAGDLFAFMALGAMALMAYAVSLKSFRWE
jgi:ABC-2 type transport system permease protein